jgi:hypothetical protein
MATATPIWIGSQEVIETPTSPRLERDATRFSVTRIYEGPYDECVGTQPTQGQAFADLPAACLVVNAYVESLPGGKGRLTVKAETSGPSETTPYAPTYENEWVEVDKNIEEHPIFFDGSTSGTTAGKYALTIGDRAAVQAWENEDDFSLKAAYQFKILNGSGATPPDSYTPSGSSPVTISGQPYNIFTLSSNAQALAQKKLRGQTTYRLRAPVCRETIESMILPTSNPCDVIENPPSACQPPTGYVYVRSAQRGTKTGRYGKWLQQREWEGADYVDTDIYPNGG